MTIGRGIMLKLSISSLPIMLMMMVYWDIDKLVQLEALC
uniref:Uncharacterized protein n=1 Tax=Rhizophora mucronata TaxID=61149 RepID=A0A2P2NN76_RHIMU